MEQFLGAGNGLGDYFLVLLVYAGLFVVMQQIYPRIDPDFRKSFRLLFFAYGIGIFIANYVLFRLGFMSFMPWLNNFSIPSSGLGSASRFSTTAAIENRSGSSSFCSLSLAMLSSWPNTRSWAHGNLATFSESRATQPTSLAGVWRTVSPRCSRSSCCISPDVSSADLLNQNFRCFQPV
jgi:hypothetical protein